MGNQLIFPSTLQTGKDKIHSILFNINEIMATGFAGSSRMVEGSEKFTNSYGNAPIMYDSNSSTADVSLKGMNLLLAQYKRTTESIVLQMPDNLQAQYGVNWRSSEVGLAARLSSVAMAGYADYKKVMTDENADTTQSDAWMQGLKTSLGQVSNLAQDSAPQIAAGMMQSLTGVNFNDLLQKMQGKIVNPLVEVLFDSITNRRFNMNFRFFPKNAKEAKTVNDIIISFKKNMHPELKTGAKPFLKYPNTFDITFLKPDGKPNEYLFRFSTCALISVTDNPMPDIKLVTHKDGAPVSRDLSLTFLEMEQLTRQRFDEGQF